MAKTKAEIQAEAIEMARESYSFISRFKRTKLIVALLTGGTLLATGLATLEASPELAVDLIQLSVWIFLAYIGGQSLVDFAEKLRGPLP